MAEKLMLGAGVSDVNGAASAVFRDTIFLWLTGYRLNPHSDYSSTHTTAVYPVYW